MQRYQLPGSRINPVRDDPGPGWHIIVIFNLIQETGTWRTLATAWCRKSSFTFSDAIAAVRTRLWLDGIFQRFASDRERHKIPPEGIQHMVETLCFAA